MRGQGRDTVKAAKTENNRDAASGAKQTAQRTQSTLGDRANRQQVNREPHLYPPIEDEDA